MKFCLSHSGKYTTESVWEYSEEESIALASEKEK
jgi:hypothetical protein